jgi:hypothetical protein
MTRSGAMYLWCTSECSATALGETAIATKRPAGHYNAELHSQFAAWSYCRATWDRNSTLMPARADALQEPNVGHFCNSDLPIGPPVSVA